jgi:hypothetical protein
MLARCPSVGGEDPQRVRLSESLVKPERPIAKPKAARLAVAAEVTRAKPDPKCDDPSCGYRKLYEDRKGRHLVRTKMWRAKKGNVPF